MTTIPTFAEHRTSDVAVGEHQAKATATTENMTEASRTVWENGRVDTGLWECTAGSFTAERNGYTEICTILSGSVTLEADGEKSEVFGPGDIMVMPSGWKGIWHVHEALRKHYTIIND